MDPFHQFVDENKNFYFISNASNIKKILSTADKLYRDEFINIESYDIIMVNSFLGEVSKFISKLGINMVLINIHVAVNHVKT